MSLHELRRSYRREALLEDDAGDDPIALFGRWFATARSTEAILEPNAMTLATVGTDGAPDARMVLLKEIDEAGRFVFYTNRESAKGEQIAARPDAALVFWWEPLERQVRVRGGVSQTTEEETRAYYETRPVDSRLGAWASRQSRDATGRAQLEQQFAEARASHPGEAIPVPPWWGGYRVEPRSIEFWQGRDGRLHDRIRFEREAAGAAWSRRRLQP